MSFLYEIPWWLPGGLALVGVVMAWTGSRRLERRVVYAGLAMLLIAAVLTVVSYLLESDREHVVRRTREIVEAVEQRDWPTVERLVHPNVSIGEWRTRAELVSGAQRYTERFGLKRASISSIQATPPRPTIITHIRVFADAGDATNFPTDWELEWDKTGQDWLLVHIEPLGGPGPYVGTLADYFRKR